MTTSCARRMFALLAAGSMLVAFAATGSSQPEPAKPNTNPNVDHEGFPLPDGAIARVGSARFRTGNIIASLAFWPDGKTIAAASHQDVQIWDVATGKRRHHLKPSEKSGFLRAMALHSDGKRIDLLRHGLLCTFDLPRGEQVASRAILEDVFAAVCLSRDGSVVAIGGKDATVRLLDVATGKEKCRATVKGPRASKLAFSPDGTMLAARSTAALAEILDARTGKSLFALEAGFKSSPFGTPGPTLGFSTDSTCLVTSDFQSPAIVWDLATGKELSRLEAIEPYGGACPTFSPDSKQVAVGTIGKEGVVVRIYQAETGKSVGQLPPFPAQVTALAYSPDGKTLAIGDENYLNSLWDAETGKRRAPAPDPFSSMNVVRFTKRDKHLLTVTDNKNVVYDWKAGREVDRYQELLGAPLLSPDGKMAAVLHVQGILLKDARTGATIGRASQEGLTTWLTHFSPDGSKFYYVDRVPRTIHVWDIRAGKLQHELRGHKDEINQLHVSPDGRWLGSAASGPFDKGVDGGLLLWEVASGRLVGRIGRQHEFLQHFAFSPDGNEVAIQEYRMAPDAEGRPRHMVRFVELPTGVEKRAIPAERSTRGFAYSTDGRMFAVWTTDETIHLWETASGEPRQRFTGHTAPIGLVAFSADSSLIASASKDAPIFVWDVYARHGANGPPPEKKWSADAEKRFWDELAGKDAARAFQTIRRLIHNPESAVTLLRKKLTPVVRVGADAKQVARWLGDLNSDDVAKRTVAAIALDEEGENIAGAVREALSRKPPPQTKARLEALLAKAVAATPDRLRQTRALEALEQIATPEAAQLLETLAGGAPAARLTREAAETLGRIRKR